MRKNPFLTASMLSFAVLFLLGLISFLPIGSLEGMAPYWTFLFLTVFLFGLPIGFFVYLRGGRVIASWNRRPIRKTEIMLSLSAGAVLIFLNAILRVGFFREAYDYRRYTLYGIDFAGEANSLWEILLLLLTLAVIPVFLEEIFFRGILMHEYRHGGVLFSALFSAVIYAMAALDFTQFPLFFLNGLMLAAVFFLTGNLFCSMIAHLLSVLFALFAEKYLFFLALESETRVLFFLFCGTLGILALIFFFHIAEQLLRHRGKTEDKPQLLPKNKKLLVLYDSLTAPFVGAALLCFAVVAVVKLFL